MGFLFLNRYVDVLGFLTFSIPAVSFVQIVGFVILYIGSLFFAWAIGFVGKSLRPSKSGVHTGHELVQSGSLGVVWPPYYISCVLMLVGLSFSLTTLWPLLLALCAAIGMGLTADAEEAH